MAGYIGSKAVLLSTTAAVVTGDIDVDGTTNLDVVDIDGAVNMATTALVTGVLTTTAPAVFNGGFATAADVSFGDNDKAIFGAGSDLQIYHDGSNSYINDTGTGDLYIRGSNNIRLQSNSGETYLIGELNGPVYLRHNDVNKLATTATGVDITGTLTSDGLTVDGIISTTNGTNIDMDAAASGQLKLDGDGYGGAIALNAQGMNIYTNSATRDVIFGTNETERMRIDGSGNVGIGTANPSEALHVIGTIQASANFQLTANDSYCGFSANGMYVHNANDIVSFKTGAAERLRIDSSGNVLVGKTVTTSQSVAGIVLHPDGGIACTTSNSGTQYPLSFARGGAYVGTVTTSASATSYNTSSDYRLKENVTAIQGAADTVMAMQPCTYTAIVDGLWYDGFLAHELQEVHPRAVQGTKDAMQDEEYEVTPAVYEDVVTPAVDAVAATYDDEGLELTPAVEAAPETTENTLVTEAVMGTRSVPDMQSVDYSKLTPILTAALQEALTKIEALEVRLTALEVTP